MLRARARAPGRRTSAGGRRRARQDGRSSPGRRGEVRERGELAVLALLEFGVDRPAVRAALGVAEPLVDALDHVVAERVAELVGVDVRLGGGVAHEVGEQPLDDPVTAHDSLGPLPARRRQDRLLVLAALDEPVLLEPLEHLAGGRPGDAEHLRDARGERRRARRRRPVLADREGEEPDRLEVFVDRVTLGHDGSRLTCLRALPL